MKKNKTLHPPRARRLGLMASGSKHSVAVSVRIRPASTHDEAVRNIASASGFTADNVIGGSDQAAAAAVLLRR